MNQTNDCLSAHVDEQGRIVLPPEVAAAYGIQPNSSINLHKGINSLEIHRPVTHLSKLYIEVTNRCNLDCRTCMRQTWLESTGLMSESVFSKIVEGMKEFAPPPSVFFGGFGEPLLHPDIIEMIKQVKQSGSTVELITNGTLLSPEISKKLLDSGIDLIWISIDGANPESYSDIRLGATLPKVIENLQALRDLKLSGAVSYECGSIHSYATKIGIAFVAMRRNIQDLPAVIHLGQDLKVERFLVTNVLPYTPEMCQEILYRNALDTLDLSSLNLPRIDTHQFPLDRLYRSVNTVNWTDHDPSHFSNHCPFIARGAGAVGWDGSFSPCLPLLHTNTSYVMGHERASRRWIIGNVKDKTLYDIWNSPDHLSFRNRVRDFTFSPCTTCGSCEMIENNEEDCFGNSFPTCGGCLWAQGIIQCP